MARSVFQTTAGDEPAKEVQSRPIAERRKPIIKGGATSDKYITAATQGGRDRTYQEIPLDQIQDSRIRDRIDLEDEIQEMMASLEAEGQKLPIIVRIVEGQKPYEVVVGRRRIAASRRLGRTVINAFVTKMSEREAFITQGVENSARLETSFIERARTAALGLAAGFDLTDVSKSLGISKTLVSFMTRIYDGLGEDLVLAIGAARGIGRRKWEALIAAMEKAGVSPAQARKMVASEISDSVERFEALAAELSRRSPGTSRPTATKPRERPITQDYLGGRVQTARKGSQIVVKLTRQAPPALLDEIDRAIEEVVNRHKDMNEGT